MLIFRRRNDYWQKYKGELAYNYNDEDGNWEKIEKNPTLEFGYTFKEMNNENYLYSYDDKNNNYHIVYSDDADEFREYEKKCDKLRKELFDAFDNVRGNYRIVGAKKDGDPRSDAGKGKYCYDKGHRWVEIILNSFRYIIAFQSLACSDKKVSCELGKIQFIACSVECNGPNYGKEREFKMMYPKSCETRIVDSIVDNETNHKVQNTSYRFGSINISELLKNFVDFVNDVEASRNEMSRLTIEEQ